MKFDKIVVVIPIIGMAAIVCVTGMIHLANQPEYMDLNEFENEIYNKEVKYKSKFFDHDIEDVDNDHKESDNNTTSEAPVIETTTKTTTQDIASTVKSDVMQLEPPKPSNATQVITSSYGTAEIPAGPNMVVQKVEPQTTTIPTLTSTPITTTKEVTTQIAETTTSTTLPPPTTPTTKPITETTESPANTMTSLCPDNETSSSESIESPPELPMKPDLTKDEEPYTPIWIKIINGMRCSMRDCHGVLHPTEAYPAEELPTLPMTRFIRGERHNVLPPCPCSQNRPPIDTEHMESEAFD